MDSFIEVFLRFNFVFVHSWKIDQLCKLNKASKGLPMTLTQLSPEMWLLQDLRWF